MRFILVEMGERSEYDSDGNPTDKRVPVVTVTSAESGYSKVMVKLAAKPAFFYENDAITAKNVVGDHIYVTFKGDKCKPWRDKAGTLRISARADSVELASSDDDTISI